jgi:hypothetical protein
MTNAKMVLRPTAFPNVFIEFAVVALFYLPLYWVRLAIQKEGNSICEK